MRTSERVFVGVCAVLLLLAAVPATVAADETRTGDRVVVAEGETVEGDLTAFGGTVVVRGTVTGDLNAFAGDVLVTGNVGGDVSAFAGNVRVDGTVGGSVEGAAGNVDVGPGATVGGNLEAGAGSVRIAGTVDGDAEVGAGTVVLAETGVVGGDLRYGGELVDRGGTVRGRIVEEAGAAAGPFPAFPGWLLRLYGALVTLLVGALLLALFPDGADGVADRIVDSPLATGAAGLVTLIAVPIALVLLLLTVVGIPVSVLGFVLFGLAAWVGGILGRYAVGAWLLGLAGVDNRWLALVAGVAALYLLGFVPVIGGLARFLVLLVGLGALALLGRDGYRGRRERRNATPAGADGAAADDAPADG